VFRSALARLIVGFAIVILAVACAAPTAAPAPTSVPAPVATAAPPSAATSAPAPTTAPTAAPAATKPAAGPTTLRIAIGVDMDTFDPAGQTTTTVANVVNHMVENLITVDPNGKIVPQLAKSWTISADGKEIVFKLQENVTFHDGTPFNAEAVKYSLERVLDKEIRAPNRGALSAISKVEAVDPLTVKLTLASPDQGVMGMLAYTTAGMLSKAGTDKAPNSYKTITQPVGTGPYVFKEYVKGSTITLARNDKYWGKKPYYDNVTFRIVPEAATRESLLLAGQVDVIILPPITDLPALQKNPAVKVLLAPSDRTIFLALNTTKKPFDDKRVRQALNYAVDKEALLKNVLFGAADELDAPMSNTLFGYCKVGKYEYNPTKAKELLKEAGVAPGTKVKMISPTGRYVQDFQGAQAVQGFLKDVGIEAELATMDWPSYVATIMKPQAENTTEIHLLGWAPAFLDAQQQFLQFTSANHVPAGLATSFYKNPKIDEMAAKAAIEPDAKKRAEMYCDASKIVWDEAPWIFMWNQRFPIVYSAKIKNVASIPTEQFYTLYAEPAQ
jgi:peptide/nickel transport system substrate-binding protein